MSYTDIEKTLKSDIAGQEREILISQLDTAQIKITSLMEVGVSPDEYKVLAMLQTSINASKLITKEMWKLWHQSK